ncbi:MAG TPA: CRISPR-associated endonuclease Cas1 [Candidatus Dormibacteraeota bacterium]|nr:CRISPR-associated endonuclease Cas1 [Candidatus Dormibacteraeota bacterium]
MHAAQRHQNEQALPLPLPPSTRGHRRRANPNRRVSRKPGAVHPRNAVTPANAVLNYLYGVLASEMTIALTGVGLDPGLGIFHTDVGRRASLSYDAMEAIRPRVDGWLAAWLTDASFSKRDFYEESDGTIRITRPLTSHLAMTAPVWHPAAQSVAGWLARAFTEGLRERRRPHAPLPELPAPRRTWQGMQPPVPKVCIECGGALAPKQRKFCSDACSASFRVVWLRRARQASGWVTSRRARNKHNRSAYPRIADIASPPAQFCFGPIPDQRGAAKNKLSDHFIGAAEQRQRDDARYLRHDAHVTRLSMGSAVESSAGH